MSFQEDELRAYYENIEIMQTFTMVKAALDQLPIKEPMVFGVWLEMIYTLTRMLAQTVMRAHPDLRKPAGGGEL